MYPDRQGNELKGKDYSPSQRIETIVMDFTEANQCGIIYMNIVLQLSMYHTKKKNSESIIRIIRSTIIGSSGHKTILQCLF